MSTISGITILAAWLAAAMTAHAGVEELQVPDRALCAICTGSTPHPPEAPATFSLMEDGTPVYFCSEPCRVEFEGDPDTFYRRALHSVMIADSLGNIQELCSGRDTAVLVGLRDDPRLHGPGLAGLPGLIGKPGAAGEGQPDSSGPGGSAEVRVVIIHDPLAGNDTGLPPGQAWRVADGVLTLLGLSPEQPLLLLGPDCTPLSRPDLAAIPK
jgi:YHS domain-containing protein